MSFDEHGKPLMNAHEYLAYLSEKCKVQKFQERQKDGLDAQMKREGKPFVSYDGTHNSGEEVVTEAFDRPKLIFNKIQSILAGSDLELQQSPAIGYLPTMDLNAVSTTAPNGDPIILLDMVLRSVLHTLITFTIYVGHEIHKAGGVEKVPENILNISGKAISAGFRLFLRHREAVPDFTEAWKWMLNKVPPEIPETGDVLCDAVIIFIISHEYAHHVLNHVKSSKKKPFKISENRLPIELVMASHAQELDADKLALDIFLKCHEYNMDFLPFRYLKRHTYAPLFFFDILSVVEATKRFRERVIKLHPPALERKKFLNDKVFSNLNEKQKDNYSFISSFLGINRQQILSLNL